MGRGKAIVAGPSIGLSQKGTTMIRLVFITLFCWFLLSRAHAQTWVDSSYEDFVLGEFDGSGHNLYASRDGKVRTIQRYDLNQDGYLDLIFNNTHDNSYDVPATLYTAGLNDAGTASELAVEGTQRVVVADLNKDGYSDLAFCPDSFGIQNTGRRFLSVLWGGEDGWPAHRSNGLLPVESATSLAVADLNKDTWPDLVVLNGAAWMPGQSEGRIVRIFWGATDGYLLTRFKDIGIEGAVTLAAADFDGDAFVDLAVLTSDKVKLLYAGDAGCLQVEEIPLPGGASFLAAADYDMDGHVDLIAGMESAAVQTVRGKGGRAWHPAAALPSFPATRAALADLDGDSWPDLVLTDFMLARAAGGEALGREGVKQNRCGCCGEVPADFPGKTQAKSASPTRPELRSETSMATEFLTSQSPCTRVRQVTRRSRVFFGGRSRQFVPGQSGVPTRGAKDVVIVPAENAHPARAVFANSQAGTLYEAVPLYVYWGGPKGFDPDRMMEIPFTSGYEASSADLNEDGFPDLVVTNSGHGGADSARAGVPIGVHVLWGGREGIEPGGRRTVLPAMGVSSTEVADLNRDGYLDLVVGSYGDGSPASVAPVRVYYGSSRGVQPDNLIELPNGDRSTTTLVADFNRDGWLDIAACTFRDNKVNVFWNNPAGFDPACKSTISAVLPCEIETADLNADGYQDLIVACYLDKAAGRNDLGVLIFWGSLRGFRESNAQWLPGYTVLGITVADFDRDGFLDLFLPNYHANGTRESLPCYIYWGSKEGFRTRCRTILMADSVSDALAGDFDGNGLIDLALSCHTRDGSHQHFSRVFYNDGQRFARPRIQHLPTKGTHWMWLQDMGRIHDRKWEQTYTSNVKTWQAPAATGSLVFEAEVPNGTRVHLEIRSAPAESELPAQSWQPVAHRRFELASGDRCLQYRVTFHSQNGDRYPVLDSVTVRLSGGGGDVRSPEPQETTP